MSVRWAIRGVPMERRLQTLALFSWELASIFCFLLVWIAWMFRLYVVLVLYFAWMLLWDTAPRRGGRRFDWFRRLALWRYMAAYFPARLIKTVDLNPQGNYIFGYHPHGIAGIGANLTFGTEALGFSDLFPGITAKLVTISSNFRVPLFRDYLMAMGLVDCDRASCDYILSSGPGQSVAICVGGAAEALDARPGVFELTLAKRKGFIRLALTHGAALVPVIAFGENDLFQQVPNRPGSRLREWQSRFLRWFGFTIPLFFGRGFINYSGGLTPFRTPLAVVVGAPIAVARVEAPSDAEVDALHAAYVQALRELFDARKAELGQGAVEMVLTA